MAAGLTVDEAKTVFAKWKPFSSSAVASSIRHSEQAATTLAAVAPGAPDGPLEKAPDRAAGPTASSTADRLLTVKID
jgi:hypothetical protein